MRPGIIYGSATRHPVASAGRVEAHQQGLPPGSPDPEIVTASLYSALAPRKQGETIALQVLLGRAQAPRALRQGHPDPLQPIVSRLWHGVKPPASDTRRKLQDHAGENRFQVALRIGVDAATSERRAALAR